MVNGGFSGNPTGRAGAGGAVGLRRFRRDEDGAILPLTLFMVVLFLAMAGLGIDTMRQEMERTRIQTTLDRAVLAGAAARDEEEARAIIEDYFDKAGMASYLHAQEEGDIQTTLNAARVSASASKTLDTFLLRLSGVDQLNAQGASTAEVRVPKLEVALVLDVSGSMRGARITALRPAARQFVTSILGSTDPGDAVISVVPFSWGVTPSDGIFNALTVNQTHDYATCLRFNDNEYNTTAIHPDTAYDQQIYTSREGMTFGDLTSTPLGSFDDTYYRSCYTDDYFRIMPYSTSEAALHARINALQAGGSTSGDEGIKWAAALLDPAFTSVVTTLQQPRDILGNGGTTVSITEVDPSLSDIPAAYDSGDTLKIIVMMGDGANDNSYFFSDGNSYRGANSNLFRLTFLDQSFSYAFDIYDPRRQWHEPWVEYYCYLNWLECVYEADGEEQSTFFLRRPSDSRMYNLDKEEWVSWNEFTNYATTMSGFISSERLPWEQAWGMMSPRFYGNTTGDWGPWNNYINNRVVKSEKDDRMEDICDAAKARGTMIYTIAFEMDGSVSGADEIRRCASSSAHHFDATTVNITSTFSAIASNVKQLRLTQ